MGLEIGLGIASLALGVISGVNQMNAAAQTTKATNKAVAKEKEAVAAQKEANSIQLAQTRISALEDRRQRIREERVRRAQILTASENSGTSGSSGESGAISALGTNLGVLVGFQRGNSAANAGINKKQQEALDLKTESSAIIARARAAAGEADAFSSFLNIFSSGINGLR